MAAERTQLSDEESNAVKAELQRLVNEKEATTGKPGKRAVGVDLGWDEKNASQAIQAALDPEKRPGYLVADRLYAYLGTTREAFMAGGKPGKQVDIDVVSVVLKETDWSALGLDAEEGARVVDHIQKTVEAMARPAPATPKATRKRTAPLAPSPRKSR